MLTKSDIAKLDSQNICETYDKWPDIAKSSYESDFEPLHFDNIDHIVFAGMGGSGAIGDLFSAILSKSNIHVSLVKGYLLPKTVDKKTLVVTTSVSGNTTETLAVLRSAHKLNCSLIAFSSGGMMEDFCKKNNILHKKIQKYHSPRATLPAYVYSILKILNSIIPINREDIYESILEFKKLGDKINSSNLSDSNSSLKLSEWISDAPLIYYPFGLYPAALRFKNSLQENAKTHAIVEDVIEACHNGIVAWEKTSSIKPILIRGMDDYIKTKERWEILKEYLHMKNIDYKEINSVNGNILTKIICLIYLLDYCSIYYAFRRGIDPTPVPSIDFVKKKLADINSKTE